MQFLLISLACVLGLSAIAAGQSTRPAEANMWVYISAKDGVHLLKLDPAAGTLAAVNIASTANTGFLAVAPGERFLYAVGSVTDAGGKHEDAVFAFAIDRRSGQLSELNHQPSTGQGSCYVTVDPSGKNVLIASYGSATVAVLPVSPDGRLLPASCTVQQTGSSVDPSRQQHAFAHSINVDPAGKFAIAADLGADKLFGYRLDSTAGKLTANDPPSVATPPGSGPRHFTFDPTGRRIYLVTEMGGTIIGYDYDAAKGVLNPFQEISALPPDFKGQNTSAEIQFEPSGRFLYSSHRDDSNLITIASVDQTTGKLAIVGYQSTLGTKPRNFRVDPTGKFMIVANQGTGTLVLFHIDPGNGKLTPVGQPIAAPGAQCVKFVTAAE